MNAMNLAPLREARLIFIDYTEHTGYCSRLSMGGSRPKRHVSTARTLHATRCTLDWVRSGRGERNAVAVGRFGCPSNESVPQNMFYDLIPETGDLL
jgi:hypothetical protein